MSDRTPIRRALLSVYDKDGVQDLARALAEAGVELVSTGSTAALLREAGLEVVAVEDVTGFPECLDDRVKTLHPGIHAGLLADRTRASHRAQLEDLGIAGFDLLVSNLYPFTETVLSGADTSACIEKIDIGGPAMVRAAAKNHASVAVVTSTSQYSRVLEALSVGGFTLPERQRLAAEAFVHTAAYDVAVAGWMQQVVGDTADGTGFPAWRGESWHKQQVLRYGENSHQASALYVDTALPRGWGAARQLGGKEMSHNNYIDADAARRAAFDFGEPCVAIIKHTNPCGIAVGADVAEAHHKAHACDPVSAFGGIVAANRTVGEDLAAQVAEIFTEVIVAPGFSEGALEILRGKKNLRIMECPPPDGAGFDARPIDGAVLVQTHDAIDAEGDDPSGWTLATGEAVDDATLADLAFAWRAVRAVKSNAILLASGGATVGVGMGQVNRVDAAQLAVQRAGERAAGSVAASDAFFPFPDGLQVLIDGGVRAVVQPGGSIRDEAVIEAAAEAGVTMYLTGVRHFNH